jgi:hypothetical protein
MVLLSGKMKLDATANVEPASMVRLENLEFSCGGVNELN